MSLITPPKRGSPVREPLTRRLRNLLARRDLGKLAAETKHIQDDAKTKQVTRKCGISVVGRRQSDKDSEKAPKAPEVGFDSHRRQLKTIKKLPRTTKNH